MREKYLLYFALGVLAAYSIAATSTSLSDDALGFPDGSIQRTAAAASSGRWFYLSECCQGTTANGALGACAQGYHMASLFELLDVSNLRYNTDLGQTEDDVGSGPLTTSGGWVRTGWNPDNGRVPGHANCSVWTDSGGTEYGTVASLAGDWSRPAGVAAPNGYMGPWQFGTAGCIGEIGSWCIED